MPAQQATSCALIVNELLQNAVEHGFANRSEGLVRVRLSDEGDGYILEIADNGAGLAPGFNPDHDGSLGLQIVRTLVRDDLRGRFKLIDDGGVRAIISFPKLGTAGRLAYGADRDRSRGQPLHPSAKVRRPNVMTQTRVVIADDESIIRMDLREMLESLGYLVVGEAGDGISAVNLARELKPDLVIMDIKMPDLDGIAAAKMLTEERIAPVLLLTAFSQQELVEGAQEAGVVGYIVKPFRESELLPAIEVALARFREFRALEHEADDLRDTLETRKLVERAKGVLMDTQGLKEADAFRKIQKLSMNTRKSMREIAEAILLAHEVEKETL